MQNAALRTATGCTQDTNIQHLHDETLILPIDDIYSYTCHNTNIKHNIHQIPYTNIQQTSTTPDLKNIFNNGRYTTNIPTGPYTVTTTAINCLYASSHKRQYKYCAHLHHPLTVMKRYFPASLVAPLPDSEQINHPSSNHTCTKPTPNHIHHHYAPAVTLTQTTHIISSTAPTYAPHCHPWICGQPPPELLHYWPDERISCGM